MFVYLLKDFDGNVAHEMKLREPIQFPYVMWNQRLFVMSRDEPQVLLERHHHVLAMRQKSEQINSD